MPIVTSINKVDENGRNALHHAVILGDLPLVEFLINHGANIKAKDNDQLIPLRYAEQFAADQPTVERMQIVSLVLEKTFGVNAGDEKGWPPIVWSLMAGDYPRVIELLDREAEIFVGPNSRRRRGAPPQDAVWAAEHLQDDRAIKILTNDMLKKYSGSWMTSKQKRLIDLVANSHQDDEAFKNTAQLVPDGYYFEAVNKGYLKFAQAMVDRGFNPAVAKDRNGVTPIMRAAKAGQLNKMQELVDNGAQVDSRVLFLAISSGNPKLVEAILEDNSELVGKLLMDLIYGKIYLPHEIKTTIGDVLIGTNPDDGKQKIYRMLTKARRESSIRLPSFATIAKLQLLRELKLTSKHSYLDGSLFSIAFTHDLNRELREILSYADNITRMRWAVYLEDIELLKQALAEGADVNDRSNYRSPVLNNVIWGIVNSQQKQLFREMMILLLVHGADSQFATHTLVETKDFEGVKILLDHGADPNQLVTATFAGDHKIIELLIAYGADINSSRGQKETPLKVAAKLGRTDLVLRYLNLGAELDDYEQHLGSAFNIAVRNGHLEIVKILYAHGAKTDLDCYLYGRPIETARKFGHTNIVEFLEGL